MIESFWEQIKINIKNVLFHFMYRYDIPIYINIQH